MEPRVVTPMGLAVDIELSRPPFPAHGRAASGERFAPKILALEQLGDMGSRGHDRVDLGRGVIASLIRRDGGADVRRLAQ